MIDPIEPAEQTLLQNQVAEINISTYKKASFLERFIALIIDGLILLIIFLLLYITLQRQIVGLNILAALISAIYSLFFIWKKGATPGKMAMKIKVISASFQRLTLWQAILREGIGKFLSELFFNLGYFWVLIDKNSQAWHDKIANTFVLKVDSTGSLMLLDQEEPVTKRRKIAFALLYLSLGLPFLAATIFLIGYIFFFRPFQMTGQSMSPAFKNKEYLLTSVISYQNSEPQRGDIIIFYAPNNPEKDLIKRIIGLPGETVMIKENKVYIDDKELDEKAYLPRNTTTLTGSFLKVGEPVTVPDESYFVLGDNRPFSSDSREWGFVPKRKIIGKVLFLSLIHI